MATDETDDLGARASQKPKSKRSPKALAKGARRDSPMASGIDLRNYLPDGLDRLDNPQTHIPRIAKDEKLTAAIDAKLREIPTRHDLHLRDARGIQFLEENSVHLVVTSPPYWTLKDYNPGEPQLGYVEDYTEFLKQVDKVWKHCYRALVPGGRLVIVVGDVCLSRRKNNGRHTVVPLHASIQDRCMKIGFDNLAPIIWNKIANAVYEAEGNGAGFLGKPYEPNAVIKNDIEFILMQRKSGGYRSPSEAARILSVISSENHQKWFQQVWTGLAGASTRKHPAPYPEELAERLIRMFSFAGDTVLDPFMGTGTTSTVAARLGRHSVGIEIDPKYFEMAWDRVRAEADDLFANRTVNQHKRCRSMMRR